MELYLPLPDPLHSSIVKDLPLHLIKRIRYLWISSFESLGNEIEHVAVSHRLSRAFMELVIEHGVILTDEHRSRICEKCCVLQIPTFTCRTRIRSRSKHSRCNKKNLCNDDGNNGAKPLDASSKVLQKRRFKNEIIRTCLVCSHITNTNIGCSRKKRKADTTITATAGIPQPLITEKPVISNVKSTPAKKFSFHESLQRRLSAPAKLLSGISGDFVPLDGTTTDFNGESRFLTLLEREQLNKKMKKRRTIGGDAQIVLSPENQGSDDHKSMTVKSLDVIDSKPSIPSSSSETFSGLRNPRDISMSAIPMRKLPTKAKSNDPANLTISPVGVSSLVSLKNAFSSSSSTK